MMWYRAWVIRGPVAYLLGWLWAGAAQGLAVASFTPPEVGAQTRLLSHALDFGHFAALGLLTWVSADLWARFGHKRTRSGLAVLLLAALAVASLIMPADLADLVMRTQSPPAVSYAAASLAVALLIPCACVIGHTFARMWVLVLLLAALGVIGNNLVLNGRYAGLHFFVAWACATLSGAALAGAAPVRPWHRGLQIMALVAGLSSLLVNAGQDVWTRLTSYDGSVLAQQIAAHRGHGYLDPLAPHEVPARLRPWFAERDRLPAIVPTMGRPAIQEPIIILLTIDALRAELFSDPRYRDVAPHLWRIGERSVVFTNARSPGASTLAALTAVETGLHRTQLNWHKSRGDWTLNDSTPRLTELLSEAGFTSALAIPWPRLLPRVWAGHAYTRVVTVPNPRGQRFATAKPMLAVLKDEVRGASGPTFLRAHLMDPHAPYDQPRVQGDEWTRYLAEVTECDAAIGQFWDFAEEAGVLDRLVLIIAADHGEGFGLHGSKLHGSTVYDEIVRVPLMIRAPGISPRQVDEPVSLIDIGPTILDLSGLPTPGLFMGESLVGTLIGEHRAALTRPIAGIARMTNKTPVFYWVEPDGLKAIWDLRRNTREVYDTRRDPDELHNLYDDASAKELLPFRLLVTFFSRHPYFAATGAKSE